ncbi:hypothetical protein CSIM01_08457 [Colletotrichum simmondsii]|uniref:Uncharacterized protein n=1 Tax=Colletotrichum simmondsii TaxID=703756 RepID=A0A135SI03_9PEZI|nr:hypothetical protein CSIM01_08457 [Colletotrichum simmondsii]
MHTQTDGSRLLELRNSLGRQTARPRESRLSTYPRGRSRHPSPRRLCARSVLHSSDGGDGFMTWSMLLGRFLSFRDHPAGDANGTGFAPPEVVPFLGPSRPSQFQRASTRSPRYVGCLLEPLIYILRTNAIQHNAHDWSCFAILSFELETVFGIRIDPPSVARPKAATYSRRLSRSLPLRPCFLGDATCVTSYLQKRYAARTPIPWPKCHMRRRHSIRPSYGDPFEIGGGAPSASDEGQIFCIREKQIREVRPQSSWQMDCGCATAGALTLNMLRRPGLITAGGIGHALPMSDDKKFRRNVPPKRSLALAAAGIVPRRRGAVE